MLKVFFIKDYILKGWFCCSTEYDKHHKIIGQVFQNNKNPDKYLNVKYNTKGKIIGKKIINKHAVVRKNTKASFPNVDGSTHITYKCPHCGNMIHLDWYDQKNFCSSCGIKLDWTEVNSKEKEGSF